jgi:CheY-like chemotaxis protein
LLDQLREANEGLVVSAMRAQNLAEQADVARADAETANRLKDEFLATVSHELRTPLSAILGCAQLLKTGQLDPVQTIDAIDVIARNTKASARIIDDLLDVSRIIRGDIRLDRRPVDLSAVIREALDGNRLAAQDKTIDMTFVDSAVPVFVAGDALRLTQVVSNLLSNAVKFTPRGGRIDVRLISAGWQAELQIADTGEGIAPGFMPLLFKSFTQAKMATTRHGGLGLGLAIVTSLVERHGGRVHAESPGSGKGATFTIRLPALAPHEVPESEPVDIVDEVAAAPARLDGLTILLVEDDAGVRKALGRLLEITGAKVEAVRSVRQALRAFDSFRPDVLVSDLGMPDEDGYALIRHVRAREVSRRHTPAIALTGYVSPGDQARALAAGFQIHLAKPVDADTLIAAISSLVRLGRG